MQAAFAAFMIPVRLLPTTLLSLIAALVLSTLAAPDEIAPFTVILTFFVALSADVTILALRIVGRG